MSSGQKYIPHTYIRKELTVKWINGERSHTCFSINASERTLDETNFKSHWGFRAED